MQGTTPQDRVTESRAVELLAGIAGEVVTEQRRARRWGIFFKLLIATYVLGVLLVPVVAGWDLSDAKGRAHAAVVKIDGLIMPGADADADRVIQGLRNAFRSAHATAVILDIDSPGGSPVQAEVIYQELVELRKEKPDKTVVAVIGDAGASAAYYIASAAERIFASRASLVGSIGVRMDSFGLPGLLERLGVERRLYTAGEHKGLLDPFLPARADEEAHVHSLLDRIHRQFIDAVRAGRGDRLKGDAELFSGLYWTGEEALELGLVDGIGDRRRVAEKELGLETLIDYTPAPDLLETIGRRLSASARAAFSGFGARMM